MIYVLIGLVFLIILYLIISLLIYRAIFNTRNNGSSKLKYFTEKDFKGLKSKEFSFKSNKKQNLEGKIYYYENKEYLGLLVFVHGIGAGHLAYTTEINHFAELGFIVLSYDNTGSGISEGKTIVGFSQRVLDLKYCLDYVSKNSELNKYKIVLCGHSWGAFAAMNILNYDYDVKAVVALAGFAKASTAYTKVISRLVNPVLGIFGFGMSLIEIIKFGKVANFSAFKGFKKNKSKVLFVYGKKDIMLDFKDFEKKEFNNVKVISLNTKGHRVNITDEAVLYDYQREKDLSILKQKYHNNIPKDIEKYYYDNLDYDLLVKLDANVMKKIDDFLIQEIKKQESLV